MPVKESKKRVKIYFNGSNNIKKFQIQKSTTLTDLCSIISKKFNSKEVLNLTKTKLQYEDEDKEWVTFTSNEEWKEGLDFHPDWKVPLKIKVTTTTTTKAFVKHDGIVCDSCKKGIFGDRFNCTECDDFDLCSNCYANQKSGHSHHKFDKFSKPISSDEYRKIVKERKKKNKPTIVKVQPNEYHFKKIMSVVQKDIMCDECKTESFKGPRYQCKECGDYDLCINCYLKKKNLHFKGNHHFDCFIKPLTINEENRVEKDREINGYSYSKRTKVYSNVINYDIQCNTCKNTDFRGLRFRCLDCDEFDICSTCYKPESHANGKHKFYIFKNALDEDEEDQLIKKELKKYNKHKKDMVIVKSLEQKLEGGSTVVDKIIKPEVIHHDIKCNGCDKVHFKGVRYRCLVCDDYDVCEKCHKPLSHFSGKHAFIQFDKEVTEEEEEKLIKIAKEKLKKQNEKKEVVHHDIQCNSCLKVDIKGTRYQCLDCEDLDVCNKCYKPSEHFGGKHKFIKFEKEVTEEEEEKIRKEEKQKYAKEKEEKLKKEKEQEKKKKVIHHDVKCNECEKIDIEGIRFQCIVCEDYDVCSKCYKPLEHFEGKHKFIKFEKEVSEEEEEKIRKQEKDIYEKESAQKNIVIEELNVPEDKYKVHLQTLGLLGFTNKELNLFLLQKHNGNVPKVINELKALN